MIRQKPAPEPPGGWLPRVEIRERIERDDEDRVLGFLVTLPSLIPEFAPAPSMSAASGTAKE